MKFLAGVAILAFIGLCVIISSLQSVGRTK
jgi:hypothetical protein